jgi:antitoxin FitA
VGTIQLKNVPDAVHEELRLRAARSRTTVRDYVLRLIEADQRTASVDEWLETLATREPPPEDVDVVALIRAEREERTKRVLRAVDAHPGP